MKYKVCACGCGAEITPSKQPHASRPKRYRTGHNSRRGTHSSCRVCGRIAIARDLCSRHYERLRLYGSPEGRPLRQTPTERFAAKLSISPTSGCWEWTGQVNAFGYGRFVVDRAMTYTHRFAYVMAKGAVPDGLEIDHLCRNRRCANPFHLEAVTKAENNRRGAYGAGKVRR